MESCVSVKSPRMPYLYTGTVGRAYSDAEVTSGAATGASVGASSRNLGQSERLRGAAPLRRCKGDADPVRTLQVVP